MSHFLQHLQTAYRRFLPVLYTALALYLTFLLLRFPALSLQYAFTGLSLWFQKMVPVLLPFMILSGIMLNMNLTENFVSLLHPLLHALFGTSKNGSYVMIMGFLCGFPMGAKIAGELRKTGRLSRQEGARLLSFCNNIGPIYFLSYVVPTLEIGKPLVPFLVMYGVPLLYGLFLFRMPLFARLPKKHGAQHVYACSQPSAVLENFQKQQDKTSQAAKATSLLPAIDSAILSGLTGIAKLGGYMVFFNLLNILFAPFSGLPSFLPRLYNCILEITSGIDRCGHSHPYLVLIMLPFGGFSCIAQTYSMIRDTDFTIGSYLFHKLVQTALTALCYLLLRPF